MNPSFTRRHFINLLADRSQFPPRRVTSVYGRLIGEAGRLMSCLRLVALKTSRSDSRRSGADNPQHEVDDKGDCFSAEERCEHVNRYCVADGRPLQARIWSVATHDRPAGNAEKGGLGSPNPLCQRFNASMLRVRHV